MPRTLLIKLGAIGDVIMLLPAAHRLHLAGHSIDWVCSPAVLPLLQLYPWINPISADERAILTGSPAARIRAILALWGSLPGGTFDQAVTLYYDPRYRLLAFPVRAHRKIQLSRSNRSLCLLPGRHHTDEYARILLNRPDQAEPTQLPPVPPPSGSLPPSPLEPGDRPRIILAPAGAKNLLADDALRRWPAERYAELAQELLNRGFEVVLIGGPADEWILPLFARLRVIDLIGKLTLLESLALLRTASVTVTHDTGPLHLAGLASTPVLALFGPTEPRTRIPQRPGVVALWGGETLACRPCYDGRNFAPCPSNDCMRQITVAQVLTQALNFLQATPYTLHPTP